MTGEEGWLLLEKRSNELKAYLCWGLDDASLEHLVELAHLRWTIEQFHEEAKQVLGLDRFEGRSWRGWHHHVSMVLMAYAFIALLRAAEGRKDLPSFRVVVRSLVLEQATQDLMTEKRLSRREARSAAELMVRRYSDW